MQINPLHLFTTPLAITLAALFFVAALYDFLIFRRRKKGNKAACRCDVCHHIYSVPRRTPLARCPKCGKLNEPVRE